VVPAIGEFNRSRILVRGNHVEQWLNGVKVVEFDAGALADFRRVERTAISLQNHASETWFRNLKIRPL
jgi:hypothetical protein